MEIGEQSSPIHFLQLRATSLTVISQLSLWADEILVSDSSLPSSVPLNDSESVWDIQQDINITTYSSKGLYFLSRILIKSDQSSTPEFRIFGNSRVLKHLNVTGANTALHRGDHFMTGEIKQIQIQEGVSLHMDRLKVGIAHFNGENITLIPKARPFAFPNRSEERRVGKEC